MFNSITPTEIKASRYIYMITDILSRDTTLEHHLDSFLESKFIKVNTLKSKLKEHDISFKNKEVIDVYVIEKAFDKKLKIVTITDSITLAKLFSLQYYNYEQEFLNILTLVSFTNLMIRI